MLLQLLGELNDRCFISYFPQFSSWSRIPTSSVPSTNLEVQRFPCPVPSLCTLRLGPPCHSPCFGHAFPSCQFEQCCMSVSSPLLSIQTYVLTWGECCGVFVYCEASLECCSSVLGFKGSHKGYFHVIISFPVNQDTNYCPEGSRNKARCLHHRMTFPRHEQRVSRSGRYYNVSFELLLVDHTKGHNAQEWNGECSQ